MSDLIETNPVRKPDEAKAKLEPNGSTLQATDDPGRAKSNPATMSHVPGRDDIIAGLRQTGRFRAQTIKQQIRLNNGCRALVGRALGFRIDLSEAERKSINRRTDALIKAIEDGEPAKKDADAAAMLAPFVLSTKQAVAPFDKLRRNYEKTMVGLVEQLPAWEWVQSVRGFGALGFSIIIAETGDLSLYANPAKIWKRLGLALIGDKRQGAPGQGASAEVWQAHGYSPARRSAMWVIGDSLLKGNGDGPYRAVYLEQKARLMQREGMTKMHAHRMAQRYMEKRLLRDLWRAWRDALGTAEPKAA